jgi:hypothetical protein
MDYPTMWNLLKKLGRWTLEAAVLCVVLFLVAGAVLSKVQYSFSLGNKLAGECDAGSEADGLNSGMNYYKNGFLINAGLPDRGHPHDKLFLDPNDTPYFGSVYTHYPPGPNWLIGLSIYTFGPTKVPWYRLPPIFFSGFCLIATYLLLRQSLGALLAGGILVMLMQLPMTTEMMHGIFFHSYALVLLLFQMSYVYTRLKIDVRLTKKTLFVVFMCSFIQGWLSFDYAFVASLYPLALVSGWRTAASRLSMVLATICAGLGFTTAHTLHLGQLWIYYGAFERAYTELLSAGAYRMNGNPAIGPELTRWDVLKIYFTELLPSYTQAVWFSWILPLSAAVVAFSGALLRRARFAESEERVWRIASIVALCAAFLVSIAWISLMKNHAAEGGHRMFLPRHFILLLFACLLVVGDALDRLFSRGRSWMARRHASSTL